MNLSKIGSKNPLFGKKHTEETKTLIRLKKLGLTLSEDTKFKIIKSLGHSVYLYKITNNLNSTALNLKPKNVEFKNIIKYEEDEVTLSFNNNLNNLILIKKFNSIRELSRYFNVSSSTISIYLKSGLIFKNYYKLSKTPLLKNEYANESGE
jgi:DNA-binding transcriptional ArsR family regulator